MRWFKTALASVGLWGSKNTEKQKHVRIASPFFVWIIIPTNRGGLVESIFDVKGLFSMQHKSCFNNNIKADTILEMYRDNYLLIMWLCLH